MFLHTLRELIVDDLGPYTELSYRCKLCNKWVVIQITTECFQELRQGLPFRSVFRLTFVNKISLSEKREQLINFEKGICNEHGQS